MTTQTLPRRWALPAGLLALLLSAMALVFISHHWSAFIQWCLSMQIALHRYLVFYLLQINNHQYTGGVWLLVGSFFYGVLHAIGPGHGKFIVTTYLSTNQETPLAGRVVPFLGSMMQGVSAIVFVFVLAIALNLSSGDLSESRWYVEKISAVMIGCFGIFIVLKALRQPAPLRMKSFTLITSDATTLNHHSHDDRCGCGHNHGVGYDGRNGNWLTHLGVILAIGARPCSGAIMILVFSNALGFISWGIAAVMTMALGTALSILGLSMLVTRTRDSVGKLWLSRTPTQVRIITTGLKVMGGLLIVLFAVVLFITTIPVSASGDFIAAGC
ncbi:nickel/cobalt transporter [Enterobacter sp. Cy-643]|uniref:nickel/cobalt transporter n=1 Tax=Enterobacter sp. Cy-643 TaxID=2608346 RepID=UPI0014218ABD|nr:nickel/cobalt transporter [Enterobacter sp. Cy-643]NIF31675.1 nickel/cobalt transporter [Enterobacter sp. Cy-643]